MDEIPKTKSSGDVAREVGRAIISAVPGVGGPLQVMFENLFASPIEKRKEVWFEKLAEVISEIQKQIQGLTPERLVENNAFVTLVMQATQVAIRNHQQVKLEALRNAVLNSALPNPPQEDEQMIFLRLIDHLTPWHLRVLSVLNNPVGWMERNSVRYTGWSLGGVSTVIEYCLPDLRGQADTYDQIVRDLQSEGFIHSRKVYACHNDWTWNSGVSNNRERKAVHQIHYSPSFSIANQLVVSVPATST